jgi:hypothetical protein
MKVLISSDMVYSGFPFETRLPSIGNNLQSISGFKPIPPDISAPWSNLTVPTRSMYQFCKVIGFSFTAED